MKDEVPPIRPERWPVVALGLLALALIAGGWEASRVQERVILERRYAELTSIGQLKVREIADWRWERLSDVRVFTHGSLLAELAGDWFDRPQDAALRARITRRLRDMRDDMGYLDVLVTAPDARLGLSANGDHDRLDAATAALARDAVGPRQRVFGDFYRCTVCGRIHVDVLGPLVAVSGRVTGVLILRSDPAERLYPRIASWPTPSATAETLLVRREGDHVLYLNELRHRKDAALSLRLPLADRTVPAAAAVLAQTGRFQGVDYRGKAVLADIRPVPGSPWSMVAKVDLDEALADARLWTKIIGTVVALLLLLAVMTLAFLTRRRQRNLYRLRLEAQQARLAEARQHAMVLAESEERFRTTLYSIGDAVITLDTDGRVQHMNPTAETLTGWRETEATGHPIEEVFRIVNEETRELVENPARRVLESGKIAGLANHTVLIARDGTERPIDDSGAPIRAAGGDPRGVVLVFRDQTRDREARARQRWLSSILEQSLNEVFVLDTETLRFVYVSPGALANLGYSMDEMRAMTPFDIARGTSADRMAALVAPLQSGERARIEFESVHRRRDGSCYDVFIALQMLAGPARPQLLAIGLDVTARNQLEETLRQAQRMEAIGRLAGGIAHDFNNLLSVINNYADFGIEALPAGNPVRDDLGQIRMAGRRAAALTRQLLAFGRKQIFQPEFLDMGAVVTEIEPMLRRLIGEHVVLRTSCEPVVWSVLADRGQIEQVLVNLAANARDAMPDGGTLTIETANAELDADYAASHVGASPGRYVALTVSDTGVGIDEDTRPHVFEPFFTTKPVGLGTGLGLATVYGIVKQSGGNVWVYSEPGRGASFRVYLPAAHDATVAPARRDQAAGEDAGAETVLVVEDEPAVRALAARILQLRGYRVVVADGGPEALRLCGDDGLSAVDLLITDVVMPHMSGRQLADTLRARWPALKVLYMSGYTEDAIVHHGVLEPGIDFLGKPFTARELARKVRATLDGSRPALKA
jgi:PAS domain S-box-containing protein